MQPASCGAALGMAGARYERALHLQSSLSAVGGKTLLAHTPNRGMLPGSPHDIAVVVQVLQLHIATVGADEHHPRVRRGIPDVGEVLLTAVVQRTARP